MLALANSIKGDTLTSNSILDDILKEFTLDDLDELLVSKWNFIDILNIFSRKTYLIYL